MFEISTETSFAAAHHLREYCGSCEKVHGHNWLVRATVRASELNPIGLGMDFKLLKKYLKAIVDKLDHTDLNTIFKAENPSSENIAKYVYYELAKKISEEKQNANVKVHKIDVWETPTNRASYFEQSGFSRFFRF